eukprot:GHVH01006715.1.p1 GENE.GHVH01006715.1~~GHVH01006715.1.p1  ORF type:complete len:212 (+),score=28.77 GHVH01006715.1:134-769(+)
MFYQISIKDLGKHARREHRRRREAEKEAASLKSRIEELQRNELVMNDTMNRHFDTSRRELVSHANQAESDVVWFKSQMEQLMDYYRQKSDLVTKQPHELQAVDSYFMDHSRTSSNRLPYVTPDCKVYPLMDESSDSQGGGSRFEEVHGVQGYTDSVQEEMYRNWTKVNSEDPPESSGSHKVHNNNNNMKNSFQDSAESDNQYIYHKRYRSQ